MKFTAEREKELNKVIRRYFRIRRNKLKRTIINQLKF